MYHVISSYLSCAITIIGVVLFAKIVLDTKIKIRKPKFIVVLLICSILYTYDFLNFEGTTKTIIMFLINMIIYKNVFEISYAKSIILTVLHIITLIIPDSFLLLFATKILKVSMDFYYDVFAGSIACNAIVCILFIITTLMLRKPLKKLVDYRLENNVKIIIYSISTFVCVAIFFYVFISKYKTGNNIIEYLLIMIVSVSILLSLIKQTVENNRLVKRYDKLLEFMTTYEEEIEKQRVLRHETKNEFINIKSQITDNEKKDKILEYINDILNDKRKVKFEEYAKFQYLPANGIKGLCYFKVSEAQTKGINVGINISSQLDKTTVYNLNTKQQRDFGKILGVFLDNAIEASSLSEEKQMGLEAYNRNGEFQMIISNTYAGEINTDKVGKERYSTKGKNRGHGLMLVKSIVENNTIFEIETKVNEQLYIQYIKIKKSI